MEVAFYANHVFMLVANVKRKMLKILFSKIYHSYENFRSTFFRSVKISKKLTVGIIIRSRIKSIVVGFKSLNMA